MNEFEKTIIAWYDSGKRQIETGEYLFTFGYKEMPCYHFRMSVEIFLKTLCLFYMEEPNLGYFDQKSTHKLPKLLKEIKNSIGEEMFYNYQQSIRAFRRVKYPHYKYIIYYGSESPQSPSDMFSANDTELHRRSANSVLELTQKCLSEDLPNVT